jgi:hydroxymethylpyrimidine kinase/phosphomethylpyrimidine kinase
VALTIAGSDSGGGAGIQADLKTFEAFGVYGTSAVTAVTVQNTVGVYGVHTIPADIVIEQIRVVAADLGPAACKSGMLADVPTIGAVAGALSEIGIEHYVLDPVMVAASGDALLDPDAVGSLRSALLPLASLVTPNLDEAAILADMPVRDETDMREARLEGLESSQVPGGECSRDRLHPLGGDHCRPRPGSDSGESRRSRPVVHPAGNRYRAGTRGRKHSPEPPGGNRVGVPAVPTARTRSCR